MSPRQRLASALDTAHERVIEATPAPVKRLLAGPYNRIQVRRADRAFRERSLPAASADPGAPAHVLVVVVDALRDDCLTSEVAPALTERRRRDAITPSPWTFPAVTSLVTGQYPHEHGAMRQTDEADTGSGDLTLPPTMAAATPTLPEALASAGYDTYGAFAFHMPFFALSGRFERHALYDDADARTLLADYRSWLASAGERTFAYLHLGDLHEPVDPPARYWQAFAVDRSIEGITRWRYEADPDPGPAGERYRRHRRRLYRAALAAVDDTLSTALESLRQRLDGDLLVVVTGDHGEGFWEQAAFDAATFTDSRPAYCVDHGGTPYEPIVRVPLCVAGPGADAIAPETDAGVDGTRADASESPGTTAARRPGPASLVDIAPTLAGVLGVEDALDTSGCDLRRPVAPDRIPIVEATRYGHERKAAYLDGYKLVVSRSDDASVGFSLPEETPVDLPADVQRRLTEALPPWPDGDGEAAVSGMARQRLEDLGYV